MKVSELEGANLDYWVCKAYGRPYSASGSPIGPPTYSPSTDWSQGGPIIEREKMDIGLHENGKDWVAVRERWKWNVGPTPLIAAMRCLVASKFGEEVPG